MALIHRAAHEGQAAAIAVGVLLAVPAFKEIELNLARVEIEGVNVFVGQVAEAVAHHQSQQFAVGGCGDLLPFGTEGQSQSKR